MALLARREHSRQELKDKLSRRGYAAAELEALLDELTASNSLSEERAAEMRLRHGLESGHGPRRIRANLMRAGLTTDGLNEHALVADVDWIAAAQALIARRFGDAPVADLRAWGKRARFLEVRGYHREDIRKALGSFKATDSEESDD